LSASSEEEQQEEQDHVLLSKILYHFQNCTQPHRCAVCKPAHEKIQQLWQWQIQYNHRHTTVASASAQPKVNHHNNNNHETSIHVDDDDPCKDIIVDDESKLQTAPTAAPSSSVHRQRPGKTQGQDLSRETNRNTHPHHWNDPNPTLPDRSVPIPRPMSTSSPNDPKSITLTIAVSDIHGNQPIAPADDTQNKNEKTHATQPIWNSIENHKNNSMGSLPLLLPRPPDNRGGQQQHHHRQGHSSASAVTTSTTTTRTTLVVTPVTELGGPDSVNHENTANSNIHPYIDENLEEPSSSPSSLSKKDLPLFEKVKSSCPQPPLLLKTIYRIKSQQQKNLGNGASKQSNTTQYHQKPQGPTTHTLFKTTERKDPNILKMTAMMPFQKRTAFAAPLAADPPAPATASSNGAMVTDQTSSTPSLLSCDLKQLNDRKLPTILKRPRCVSTSLHDPPAPEQSRSLPFKKRLLYTANKEDKEHDCEENENVESGGKLPTFPKRRRVSFQSPEAV
jgi:hypothetical protein